MLLTASRVKPSEPCGLAGPAGSPVASSALRVLSRFIAPVVGIIACAFAEQPAHDIDRRLVQPLLESDGSKRGGC